MYNIDIFNSLENYNILVCFVVWYRYFNRYFNGGICIVVVGIVIVEIFVVGIFLLVLLVIRVMGVVVMVSVMLDFDLIVFIMLDIIVWDLRWGKV